MKQHVGIRRINKEWLRHQLAIATVPRIPILLMPDGTARIPLSVSRLSKLAK